MKVKQIMALAAELCGRRDVADYLDKGLTADAAASEREEQTLLRCYNLAENEIALDYLPLKKRETFASDGFIAFSAFAEPPLEIFAVRGDRGEKLPFSQTEEGIRVHAGNVEVTYSYRPVVKEADDEPSISGKAGERVLALGTACEYALMSGLLDAAQLLDVRYRDALACACRERGGRMKMRRWA